MPRPFLLSCCKYQVVLHLRRQHLLLLHAHGRRLRRVIALDVIGRAVSPVPRRMIGAECQISSVFASHFAQEISKIGVL